ncbi:MULTISPECIES: spermidine/putrescine ABC transporter substrate-binding protein [Micromonospora]|uniref:ABC transporter substrate-binding protein n=1 Tax=Micromonospora sicca TaxID=2202420 RepID=A0A317DUG2_9ACTN|nr:MULTISPECIES: spermidine/putrescine ABC transporter substrate-binding protein [unclassified Micromonospora]MBM0227799.1 spermidine/putrescine ABC transporter substrate-binding protein [Micromonospora sp. ATA51]MDZ5442089.1 spermidine/putrescine ABC transporter substrate-binding protein [Micromonospora sp. 4G57]MDZ5490484.1 spermidine/putrescine ABC transporter substrate-binding protein [Micromonospora sp. 4G53]PWR16455.1 ABC transporter substrate-binding protein [Micromonospora sp. 4G51]
MRSPLRPLTRRGLLTGTLGSAALLATAGALTGCGTKGAQQTEAGCKSDDLSATEKKLAFSNWPQYMDVDEKDESKRPTLDAFIAKSGIQVTYTEDVNDNNEFFGKVQNQLAGCQTTGRDIMVLTDWMAARMIRLGWIQKLDKAKMPNVEANLLPSLRNRSFDPDSELAIPWQSGLAGLAYNAKVAKEIRTVDELLTRPDLKGKVTALSEMRDTMGLLLQSNGHDPANFTAAQFDDALNKLKKAVESKQIRKFTGNDYAPDLAKGDIAACIGWSGDVIQLGFEDEKIKFVVPDSGVMLWSDNMLVPNKATHRANAEELMNYYYDPAVAAKLAAYVNYICPVKGAQAEMEKIDPDLAANPLIFPDEAMLSKSKVFMALDEKQEKEYEAKFQQVIGA